MHGANIDTTRMKRCDSGASAMFAIGSSFVSNPPMGGDEGDLIFFDSLDENTLRIQNSRRLLREEGLCRLGKQFRDRRKSGQPPVED